MEVPAADPWSIVTPEKSDRRVACGHESMAVKANLPEKCEMLAMFFEGLHSSIRLLQLRGSLGVSFKNIKPVVETLVNRRFTCSHLAQLKFILPEAIQIKQDPLKDESDLVITLNPSAVVDEGKVKSGSANLELWNIFQKRLFDFLEAHPEEDDIPEAELQEPLRKSECDTLSKALRVVVAPVEAVSEQKHHLCHNLSKPLASASHLAQSFRPSFSQRNTLSMKEKTNRDQMVCDRKAYETSSNSQPLEFSSKPNSTSCLSHLNTPIKDVHPSIVENGTPAKLASTPTKVMTSTPVFPAPLKRCCMSPEDESSKSSNKLVRRSCRGRLVFDMTAENASSADQASETGTGSSDYKDLLLREKERKETAERNPAISQSKQRKQLIASLPKMFNTICCLFQSIHRSVITKKELMHKILADQIDLADGREAEEQLRLLYEFAPEWIYEKMASSGDLLVCVNKNRCPNSIGARLADAK